MATEQVTLERQVRRLRFTDAAQEERFQLDRQVGAVMRARVTTIVGIFVVAGLGMLDVIYSAKNAPEYVAISMVVRFGWIGPIWLALLISTYLPNHVRRANLGHALSTVAVCWGLAYLKWCTPQYFPDANILTMTALDVALVMMISFFTLPIRFGALVAAVGVIVGGISGGFLLTMEGSLLGDSQLLTAVLVGLGVLILVSVRAREVNERQLFAQREQLAELNAELSRLNAEKNEFMTIAAHDLRSPLAAVGGMVNGLRAGQFDGAEKTDMAHQAILEMTKRMLGLVDDYLGAHAMEHGSLPVRLAQTDLGRVAGEVQQRFASLAKSKHQMIRFEPPAAPVMGEADAALLAQILDNFVSNALKFSPEGAEVEIGLLQSEDGNRVRIEVIDQGAGVPVAEQYQLFRMFGRTSVQPTSGEKSHGIGLAVTKRLAESMGGAVGCDSPVTEEGTGAAFWVEMRAR